MADRTIVVVGKTGAGKSEFVRRVITDGQDYCDESQNVPQVSAGMLSCTMHFETYRVPEPIGSVTYHLVDTKGLMDTSDDKEVAFEQLADLTDRIPTIVGFVYVLQGKMEPQEVEILDFLFTSFFDNVPASKLLILKSNCMTWRNFDVAGQKEQLEREEIVPSIVLEADWQVVDFHFYAPPEHIALMVQKAREKFSTWTDPLRVEGKYEEDVRNVQNASLQVAVFNGQERDHHGDDEAASVDDLVSQLNEKHSRELEMLKHDHKAALEEMMRQMREELQSRKGIFCSIM